MFAALTASPGIIQTLLWVLVGVAVTAAIFSGIYIHRQGKAAKASKEDCLDEIEFIKERYGATQSSEE